MARQMLARIRGLTPGWVAEVGKILLGAGAGGWLAWAGAVGASFPPHKLHYLAPISIAGAAATVVGSLMWLAGEHDDPRIALLQDELAQSHRHLEDAHRLIGQQQSVKLGTTGPQGPIDTQRNRTFGIGRGAFDRAETRDSAHRYLPPSPPSAPEG